MGFTKKNSKFTSTSEVGEPEGFIEGLLRECGFYGYNFEDIQSYTLFEWSCIKLGYMDRLNMEHTLRINTSTLSGWISASTMIAKEGKPTVDRIIQTCSQSLYALIGQKVQNGSPSSGQVAWTPEQEANMRRQFGIK